MPSANVAGTSPLRSSVSSDAVRLAGLWLPGRRSSWLAGWILPATASARRCGVSSLGRRGLDRRSMSGSYASDIEHPHLCHVVPCEIDGDPLSIGLCFRGKSDVHDVRFR